MILILLSINVKKIFKFLTLVIALLIAGYFISIAPLYSLRSVFQEYLMENYIEIHEDKENNYSAILDIDEDVNIILLGEEHGIALNEFIELDLFKYLITEKGIMNYIGEFPYSFGLALNEYIKTGDEGLLEEAFSYSEKTYFYTIENYDKWRQLYLFLKEHELNQAFGIIGVDLEQDIEFTYMQIHKILMNYNENQLMELLELLENFKEAFKKFDLSTRKDLSALNHIREEIDAVVQNSTIDKDDQFKLLHMIKNLNDNIARRKKLKGNAFSEYRDKAMYDNFVVLRDKDSNTKYFGKFGSSHIFQKEFRIKWFGSYFSEDDKVIGLLIRYKNSWRMVKNRPNARKYFTRIDDPLLLMSEYKENNMYLFNLDKKGSPFKENLLFIDSSYKDNTTDYFQYLFIVNRGRKAEHYKTFYM